MWVTRFEWPDPDQAKARETIDTIMADLAAHHFNAVLFQVRGQADTFYPSPDEPWSPLIAPTGADPGWDPLAYAIEAAHSHGLEFHAYINTHVAWHNNKHEPPPDPEHLYFQHCNAADPDARDWLIHDEDGHPVQFASDNYVWLAPGVPALQAYLRKQVMYVVTHYDVDGVHFDRIRTPGAAFSHDPVSEARRAEGSEGNPDGLDFADWTRDQFTRMLCDLYAQVMEIQPEVKVSSAPVGLYRRGRYPDYPAGFHYGYSKTYQDAQAWLVVGAMDFVVPQIYWGDGGRLPDFSHILPDWVARRAGRHIYAGQNRSIDPAELVREVRFTREQGAQGNVMFHYGGFKAKGYFGLYSRSDGVYAAPSQVPVMDWKENPTKGTIVGALTDAATDEPVVDAQVTRSGSSYVALSSADGLYSFLKVPPGEHTLTFRKHGLPDRQIARIKVAAGPVIRVDTALGELPVVAQLESQALPEPEMQPPGHPETLPASVTTSAPAEPACALEGRPCAARWVLALTLLACAIALIAVTVFRRKTQEKQ